MIAAGRRSKTRGWRPRATLRSTARPCRTSPRNRPPGWRGRWRGHLHLDALGQAGGHDVLATQRMAYAAERSTDGSLPENAPPPAGHAAVGVHDDFAAGQAGVAHGAADDEQPDGLIKASAT